MSELYDQAAKAVRLSQSSFCKFISANDVGRTGGHQCGYYVSKEAAKALFECECRKGENVRKEGLKFSWHDGTITYSNYIYYGQGTRNESRITTFGRGFEFLREDYVGSLLIVCRQSNQEFSCYVLESDLDIDAFILEFNVPVGSKCFLISQNNDITLEDRLAERYKEILGNLNQFPTTNEMSRIARDCFDETNHITLSDITSDPDKIILKWLDTETSLFYQLEEKLFQAEHRRNFLTCQELIDVASEILNRRKSRAGKSLEHHLSHIFTKSRLRFTEQCITEARKKPDFIFPGFEEYHNFEFPAEKLVFLGAKTTCKDRWRQVLNEADRITPKYLFTLQQGISSNQLSEMEDENLKLVIPESNITSFAPSLRSNLVTLKQFIHIVKETQS